MGKMKYLGVSQSSTSVFSNVCRKFCNVISILLYMHYINIIVGMSSAVGTPRYGLGIQEKLFHSH